MLEHSTEVLIVGGGLGGVAAALACARSGVSCILTESTDWLGGQLTTQAVPPDENQWVESFGANASYQSLRSAVRESCFKQGARPRAVEPFGAFNPGAGWVSRCCAEPARWEAAIRELLAEHVAAGRIRVLFNLEPVGVEEGLDHIFSVVFRSRLDLEQCEIIANYVLDATDLGDLLALAEVDHAIGAEHRAVYNELHARTDFPAERRLDELDQQACSWCFALEHRPDENHVIHPPASYARWRDYIPAMTPPWLDGRSPLFSWTVPSHNELGSRTFRMVPWPDEPSENELEMWRYRRIVDAAIWPSSLVKPDVTIINMVQMDYWRKPLLGVGPEEQAAALRGAREQSACWLYWMQTQAPRHDHQGLGYPGLKLRGVELGTHDGFAKSVYIREPRRLIARTILHEGHIGADQRAAEGKAVKSFNWEATPFGTAHRFPDSIAIGHYAIDLHPSCAGRNNVYLPCAPFQIPLGALIPIKCKNLIAAGKCLGVSHIANAATRMHHTEWAVGEAAGSLAAYCVAKSLLPAAVHDSQDHVREVQQRLLDFGARIHWPWEQ